MDKDECWTVEGQIVEAPRPRNIDGVYVMGGSQSDGDGHGHCPVSEVLLGRIEPIVGPQKKDLRDRLGWIEGYLDVLREFFVGSGHGTPA